jgi:hypothetical protein
MENGRMLCHVMDVAHYMQVTLHAGNVHVMDVIELPACNAIKYSCKEM